MKIALIGPQSGGRTTLLRALAGSGSFDPAKPLTISVPDRRVDFLKEHWNPKSVVRATVTFTDTPSPVFTPRNLAGVKNATALALVIENFALGDLEEAFVSSESELLITDLAVVENRMARLRKEGKVRSLEYALFEKTADHLSDEKPLRILEFSDHDLSVLSPYGLLSLKPLLVISNRTSPPVTDESVLAEMIKSNGSRLLVIDAAFELELSEIPEEERGGFLESMGYDDSGLSRFLRESYSLLNLVTFLTMGEDEVRAWPIRSGTTALVAAGTIHSDLARGFIRAQVIPFDLYAACPDSTELRSRGEIRMEGKQYVVQDGDIIEIKFSV